MCGLVGIAGNISVKEEKIFKELLVINSLRGDHSTGVATLNRTLKKVDMIKTLGGPESIIDTREYHRVVNLSNYVILGHGRHATKGEVTLENAHPFDFKTLVGMHNGTIKNQTLLPDHKDFKSDSKNIFHSFEKIGIPETIKILHGAFALVWFDKRNKTINFLKNSQRPLYYAYLNEKKTLVWASEIRMLQFVCAGYDDTKIYKVNDLYHYSWPVSTDWKSKFGLPKQKKLEAYVPPKVVATYSYGDWENYMNGYYNSKNNNKTNGHKVKNNVTTFPTKNKTSVSKYPKILSMDGATIHTALFQFSQAELKRKLQIGCCWCSSGVPYSERDTVLFIDRKDFICQDCQKNPTAISELASFVPYFEKVLSDGN